MHFVVPGHYRTIVPSYLPAAGALVAVSGAAEILGGVGLAFEPWKPTQDTGGRRMTEADAQRFGLEWVESWNSHDLERILRHYSEDVEVTSPLIETVLGPGRISVRGKKALRAYWGPALERYPDLRFVLYRAYAGHNSLVLHYQSVQGLVGAECMEFNGDGAVRRVLAHYALGADPVAA